MDKRQEAFGAMERKAVYRLRELFAQGREAAVRAAGYEEEAYIRKLSERALYPEKPLLSFSKECEGDTLEEAWNPERDYMPVFRLARQFGAKSRICRLIACGGVDDGKSTLIGRILFDVKSQKERDMICKNPKYLRKDGSVDHALLAGATEEENQQGITVQVSYSAFDWDGESFLMADVPGHEEYTRNMACAASEADTAIIMTAANKGIVPQTRRHARICYFMGIRHMIFAVNKMDMAGYGKAVFTQLSDEIVQMMEPFSDCVVSIVPVAAKSGVNMIRPAGEMAWYRGGTLLEECVRAAKRKEKRVGSYFCMPVQRICKSSQMEGAVIHKRVIQGEIVSGALQAGDEVFVYPTGKRAKAAAVYRGDQKTGAAEAGSPAGVELDRELDVARGYLLAEGDALDVTDRVEADILWTSDNRMTQGKRYRAVIQTAEITAAVTKIYYQTDVNTGERRHAEYLTKNALARCELCFPKPVALACEKDNRALGTVRLFDRETNSLAAYGNIVHTISKEAWKEDGRTVCAAERETALGQKAGLVLFAAGAGTKEIMNYAERYLLRAGFHTIQLMPERIDQRELQSVRRLLDAGLVVLLGARPQDQEEAAALAGESGRVFCCGEIACLSENMGSVLRQIKEWAAELI